MLDRIQTMSAMRGKFKVTSKTNFKGMSYLVFVPLDVVWGVFKGQARPDGEKEMITFALS